MTVEVDIARMRRFSRYSLPSMPWEPGTVWIDEMVDEDLTGAQTGFLIHRDYGQKSPAASAADFGLL